MSKHFQREIEQLKKKLLSLSAVVEESVLRAVNAIERRDEKIAQKVIESDIEIDHKEVDLEEDCLKILALHKPVAADLRFIIAVLKINNELERIGDLATNIAERAIVLANQPKIELPHDLPGMADKAQAMLQHSLDALINHDSQLAREVCAADDEVDALNRHMYEHVTAAVSRHPERADRLFHMLSVSRRLERVADHATNISENVIYLVEGAVVRHRAENLK